MTGANKSKAAHGVRGGSSDANRLAIAILEVLAGLRTPTDAAQVLGISLPRYYQLETRALEGMVAACEPKPKGKQPSLQGRIDSLEKQLQQAQKECARQQALVRLAQRSIGLKAVAPAGGKTAKRDKAGRKKRRPAVRALKAADALRKNVRSTEGETVQHQERSEGAQETPAAAGRPNGRMSKEGSTHGKSRT
jgi:hypothetical protein